MFNSQCSVHFTCIYSSHQCPSPSQFIHHLSDSCQSNTAIREYGDTPQSDCPLCPDVDVGHCAYHHPKFPIEMNAMCTSNTTRKAHPWIFFCNTGQIIPFYRYSSYSVTENRHVSYRNSIKINTMTKDEDSILRRSDGTLVVWQCLSGHRFPLLTN